ncbi:MAG: tetratricopeptide repeat protein [Candidatus Rokubacteria bacterium]|nr:tetratricopeptide repeat protein [Candidatus Rokubacteria bacterium]
MPVPDLLAAWRRTSRVVRWTVVALAALSLLGAAAFGGYSWYNAQDARGRLALVAAAELAQQATAAGASAEARDRALRALEAVLTEYPRFSGAAEAAYRLGNLRFEAGQHAAARGAYEIAIAKGATATLRSLAAVGIGYTWEAQRDHARAQVAFQAALGGLTPKDFLYEEGLLGLARAQEFGGNPAAARETYSRLLKERPDSRRAADIRSRLASPETPPKQ